MRMRDNAIVPDDFNNKMPFYMFKRVDLRNGVSSQLIPFKTDFGGDYLLKRIVLRHAGKCVPGLDPNPTFAPDVPLPTRDPVALDYTPLANERYINLLSLTDGHTGTDIDPFSFNDWQNFLNVNDDETTFYIRGSISRPLEIIEFQHPGGVGERVDYIAWLPELYGPPVIRCDNIFVQDDSVMMNGIVLFMESAYISYSPVTFRSCHVEAPAIIVSPYSIGNYQSSGNSFIASAMLQIVSEISRINNGWSTMESGYAYSIDFATDPLLNTLYSLGFVTGTRFTFLMNGSLAKNASGGTLWQDMDLTNDYDLELTFRIHDSTNNGDYIQFGFYDGGSVFRYGIQVDMAKVDSSVQVNLLHGGSALNIMASTPNTFEADYKIRFRKIGTRLLSYINGVLINNVLYDASEHGNLASLKPELKIKGGVDGSDTTDYSILWVKSSSVTTPDSRFEDCLLYCAAGGSFNEAFLFNCFYHSGTTINYGTVAENCRSSVLLQAPPHYSDARAEFYDVKFFSDFIAPAYPAYGAAVNYPGYNRGLWGYGRRTIAALDFSYPELRYVNLDLDTAFGGIGTAADPFSFFDLHQFTIAARADTQIRVRGSHYNQAIYDFFWDKNGYVHTYLAWNMEIYGPWRLRTIYSFDMNSSAAYVHDGILFGLDGSNNRINITSYTIQPKFFNCHLYGLQWAPYGLYDYHGEGCLIDFTEINQSGTGWKDSLLKTDLLQGNGPPDSNVNCGISAVSNTIDPSLFLNCFLTWAPPAFPAWNNPDLMAWHYLLFQTNIPDSVFIGDGVYLDYESGIFGLVRVGIGALYFLQLVPNCPAKIKVSLRKMNSAHKIFENISPVLFSSPVDTVNCEAVTAPLPVDDYLFNTLYKGSVRLSFKTFNWVVEDNATIVIDVNKEPSNWVEPQFLDIVIEGYYLKGR